MKDLLRLGRDDKGHIVRHTALYDAGGTLSRRERRKIS